MQFDSNLFTKPSFIFDMLCLAFLIIMALRYAHKGLLATLVGLCGTLASLLGARYFSNWASPLIFENFLAKSFVEKISGTIAENGSVNLNALVGQFAGFLPEAFRNSVVESFSATVTDALSSNAALMSDHIVTEVIEPLFTPIISIVLFFVAFTVCRMLVSLLVTVLTNVNRIPVVGGVNRTLGFVLGIGASLVDLFLILCVVWALIIVTGGGLPYLNEAALADSTAYRIFGTLNPFV